MAISTTLGERIKEAAKAHGLSVGELGQRVGFSSRSAFSTRINSGEIDEKVLSQIAEVVGRTPAWLRYGVQGDFRDGARWAVRQMMDRLRDLEGAEPPAEAPAPKGRPPREYAKPSDTRESQERAPAAKQARKRRHS